MIIPINKTNRKTKCELKKKTVCFVNKKDPSFSHIPCY